MSIEESLILNNPIIEQEIALEVCQQSLPSHDWYITEPSGKFYLHKDGYVRDGVRLSDINSAFWSSQEDAEEFFNQWRDKRLHPEK